MNFVGAFQEMKRIYGFCPCCGEMFRLSDAELFTKGAPPGTPFDAAEGARARIENRIAVFDAQEAALRQRAVALGQRAAKRRLKQIAPFFTGRGVDPQDVKVLFEPVEYVVFRGLSGRGVRNIELVDREPDSTRREKIQLSVSKAIARGDVAWRTMRIDMDGQVAWE